MTDAAKLTCLSCGQANRVPLAKIDAVRNAPSAVRGSLTGKWQLLICRCMTRRRARTTCR
jgi:Fe2+ or Zn2+ uptake regulation protein